MEKRKKKKNICRSIKYNQKSKNTLAITQKTTLLDVNHQKLLQLNKDLLTIINKCYFALDISH